MTEVSVSSPYSWGLALIMLLTANSLFVIHRQEPAQYKPQAAARHKNNNR
ncbi:hypothetical protein [Timonella sp. A28]